jgi:hypothetical protein
LKNNKMNTNTATHNTNTKKQPRQRESFLHLLCSTSCHSAGKHAATRLGQQPPQVSAVPTANQCKVQMKHMHQNQQPIAAAGPDCTPKDD